MSVILTGTPYDYKWRNAVESLASINTAIANKTDDLNNATTLYKQAMAAITTLGNSSRNDIAITGRHISTWRDQRDKYAPLVAQYTKDLSELLALQTSLAITQEKTATSTIAAAAAKKALADAAAAETAAGTSKVGQYALIGAIVIVVIIAGIIAFKKFKKK